MMVYQFNTYTTGGAAIAARRLHDTLGRFGVISRFYHSPTSLQVRESSYAIFGPVPRSRTIADIALDCMNVRKLLLRLQRRKKLNHYTVDRPQGYDQFSYPRLIEKTPLNLVGEAPDIIHLHWVAGLFDYPSFFSSIPESLPIVWTLHDMNPLTGGCHYSWDCQRFETVCQNCPQLNSNRSETDLAYEGWNIKRKALANKAIHIVANSYWLEQQARRSALFKHARSFQTIHYGLDVTRFAPRDKAACKKALGIPVDQFVICFGADSIESRRKGLSELMSALKTLPDQHIKAVMFGQGNLASDDVTSFDTKCLGPISTPELLSLVYSAGDVFVIPSLHEAFGQTALEAMACGTPVVGFDTGGIPDMVRDRYTGLLAKKGDAVDTAHKIKWMIEHPFERVEMGKNARRMVEAEFTLEAQARKYVALYEAIIENLRIRC